MIRVYHSSQFLSIGKLHKVFALLGCLSVCANCTIVGATYHVAFVVQFAQEVVNSYRGAKLGPPGSPPARRFILPAILFVGVYPDALTKKPIESKKIAAIAH